MAVPKEREGQIGKENQLCGTGQVHATGTITYVAANVQKFTEAQCFHPPMYHHTQHTYVPTYLAVPAVSPPCGSSPSAVAPAAPPRAALLFPPPPPHGPSHDASTPPTRSLCSQQPSSPAGTQHMTVSTTMQQ